MSAIKWFSILLIFTSAHSAFANRTGNGVGNGGDIIQCNKSAENGLEGPYSLDYILTLDNFTLDESVNWKESLERIAKLLKAKVPELYQGFSSFKKDVFNSDDFTRQHVWEKAPFGLTPIEDEQIITKLPKNCLDKDRAQLIQAVIRVNRELTGTETQVFKYMPSAIEMLETQRSLQVSFLLVHEWLWELSQNVDRNRRINAYLHSKKFAEQSDEDVLKQLRGMGLVLTGETYVFEDLQEALDIAREGATLKLVNIVYKDQHFKVNKPIRLVAADPKNPPIFQGGEFDQWEDNVTLEGLRFESNKLSIVGVKNVSVNGCKFFDTSVSLIGDARQVSFSGNDFDRSNLSLSTVVAVDHIEASVTKNTFKNSKTGLEIRGQGNYLVKVTDNTFTGNELGLEISAWRDKENQIFVESNLFQKNETGISMTKEGVTLGSNSFAGNKEDVRVR